MSQLAEKFREVISQSIPPFQWPDELIHLFIGGSGLHGATGNKPTDLDLNGIYIQPADRILGISQMIVNEDGTRKVFDPDVHVWSSSGDHAKNKAGDVDLNLYSLRKWATMAATGNTTALEFLFANDNQAENPYIWNRHIASNKFDFVSRRAGFHFAEFSKSMLKRLKGEGQGKHGQRPELEAEFGYDVKAAMHLIRVLDEGRELMDDGRITLPRPNAEFLKTIRNGAYTLPEIEQMYEQRLAELQAAQAGSPLPAELDRARISKVITDAQIEHWGWRR
jgi:predicted nucleotidyltransferase